MHNSVEQVAQNRKLNPERFADYIREHGRDVLNSDGTISTFHVDDAVRRYIAFVGRDQYENDRTEIIAAEESRIENYWRDE